MPLKLFVRISTELESFVYIYKEKHLKGADDSHKCQVIIAGFTKVFNKSDDFI